PGLAERGQVLPGVAVEYQLVRHQLKRVSRQRLVAGELVLGNGPGHVAPGEHAVRQLLLDRLTRVQRHVSSSPGHHLRVDDSDPRRRTRVVTSPATGDAALHAAG